MKFKGFDLPDQNWSKLPHAFIDQLHGIKGVAELKVVLYVLRHTWGFSEYDKPKKITTDEFMRGRRRLDGSRLDPGTGLSENGVRMGLDEAVLDGFLTVIVDERDRGRIKKYYSLNMRQIAEASANFEDQSSENAPLPASDEDRTEKETKDRNEGNIPFAHAGKNHSSKRRNGQMADPIEGAQAFERLGSEAAARGKAWKYRHLFEHDARVTSMADEIVRQFYGPGGPMKSECFALLATISNLVDNDVKPADLVAAIAEARGKWSFRIAGISDGLVSLARAISIERKIDANSNRKDSARSAEQAASLRAAADAINSRSNARAKS